MIFMVGTPGNAPGGSEDTGFTVPASSLVVYAPIYFLIYDFKHHKIYVPKHELHFLTD